MKNTKFNNKFESEFIYIEVLFILNDLKSATSKFHNTKRNIETRKYIENK